MELASLPLPPRLVEAYRARGIAGLYPPQEECVRAGLFDGRNLLVAIPTASGKTLIAEMAMHHHIARGGKCLYIVPLKALASEKFADFSGKGVRVGISTGDYDRREEYLGRNDIIIATSEKVDSLTRNNAPWISRLTLLVVDEVHLIDSEDRGATLEMVITKLRSKNPAMQVLGLSATIGNPKTLAGWLGGNHVASAWRPVQLRQGVFYRGSIRFADGERKVEGVSRFDDLNLCLDTDTEGGQSLVFVSSRRNAEAFAKRAAAGLKKTSPALEAASKELSGLAETEMDKSLAACVGRGAAFHHAGLRREQRRIVEAGFRAGEIRCIASTPTLAAGLNLPARRVIIRDYLRYRAGEGMAPIPVREYHQMAGRAGRPGLDPYGEAVLIAKDEDAVYDLTCAYIEAPPEDVHSQCGSATAICTHVLSLVATGFAGSVAQVLEFLDRTYYVHENRDRRGLGEVVESALAFLGKAEMVVRLDDDLSATELGTLVSRLYLDPRGADAIAGCLAKREGFTGIGLLHLLCSTPDMPTLYLRQADLPTLERFLFEHEDQVWLPLPSFGDEDCEAYYRALKTALVLEDWTDEVGEAMICERYGVNPGDIYSYVESVQWLVHAASRLSAAGFGRHLAGPIRDMEVRVRSGVKAELLPLVALRGIGRVRARRLFNYGIQTPAGIREAGLDRVASIIGRGIAEQVFAQLGNPPAAAESPGEQADLGRFGGGPGD
ncbi:MAG TPA: ATP-dependent DNA helicase [Methanomicrobiales archaeon]|nr:ATP-dependent DNA helicase [Methanomicrobiales archaeon]